MLAGAGADGISAPAAQAGTVRVTIAEYSKGTGPYFEAAAKAFEAANPGTKIQIEVVPWDNLQQKLTTDISAGANADLSIIGTRWLLDYVSQGVVAPLDIYVTPDFKARFIDTFLSPSVMNGKVYGLPIAASARAMYYNKDVFKKAGYDAPPANWADFKTAADKIKADRRRRVPVRPAGQGNRDRRLLLLRHVVRTAARSSRTASPASTARPRSMRRKCTRASSTAA